MQKPKHLKFREPVTLPRVIPLHTIETLLTVIYRQCSEARTAYQKKNAIRDAAVIELLFATGIRISELCSLKKDDVNLQEQSILIYGKGAKERRLQIGNENVIHALENCRATVLMWYTLGLAPVFRFGNARLIYSGSMRYGSSALSA